MKVELETWRATPRSERFSRSAEFSAQIHRLSFERIESVHPDWNHEQHKMMFFKLRYAGDHFDEFARAKIARGDWMEDEVETVRATPTPFSRADSLKYTAISHPDLDEDANIWPNAIERGTNS